MKNPILRWIRLIAILLAIVLINALMQNYFFRIDLTEEKRYSLSRITKETLQKIDRPLSIEVFLEGDFPPAIERFRRQVETILREMQVYAPEYFQFQFINPIGNKALIQMLRQQGIQPIPINIRTSALEQERKYMYPIALIYYDDKRALVDLVKGAVEPNGQINLLRAEQDLEYKFIAPIRRMVLKEEKIIAFLQGHGEPTLQQLPAELTQDLKQRYTLLPLYVRYGKGIPNSPRFYPKEVQQRLDTTKKGIDVLVIINPDSAFTEREKYEIDQFIMRGGRVLWLIDQERVNLQNGPTLSELRSLNLDDLFMKYGIKLHYDLIQDRQCGRLDVIVGWKNGPIWRSEPWIYYPLIARFEKHPVTKNIDAVLLRYASSIDTLPREGVRFKVFMRTSPLSRSVKGTVFIDLTKDILDPPPPQVLRGKGNRIVGVELEGYFASLFKGRKAPVDSFAPEPPKARFFEKSVYPTKMIIISDGDLAAPLYIRGKPAYMPLDNKYLIINCIDYLAGDEAINYIRAKDIKVRMLSKEKVRKYLWQIRVINLVVPIIAVFLFGWLRFLLRKKRYGT